MVNPCCWIVTVKTVYMPLERKRKRDDRKKEKKRD